MLSETRRKIKTVLLIAILAGARARDIQQNVRFHGGPTLQQEASVRGASAADAGQEHAEHVAHQLDRMTADPRFHLEVDFSAKQIDAMMAKPNVQEQPRTTMEDVVGLVPRSSARMHAAQPRRLQAKPVVTGGEPRISDEAICARNVMVGYIWSGLAGVWFGITQGPTFDKYLFELTGKNSQRGLAASIAGISSLLSAIPVGYLVDRRPEARASLCKFASILGVIAVGGMTQGIISNNLIVIYIFLAIRGVFYELTQSVTGALFTDSTTMGNRSQAFTKRIQVITAAASAGPVLSAIASYALHDEWTMPFMKTINIAGNMILPFGCLVLLLFRDPPIKQKVSKKDGKTVLYDSLASDPRLSGRRFLGLRPKHVPWILAAANFVTFVGAGLVFPFYSLFWTNDWHFKPSQTLWLQALSTLLPTFTMPLLQMVQKRIGRAQTALLSTSLAIPCLVGIARLHHLWLLLTLYLLRACFLFSVFPIQQTIQMDFTPRSQRGRWQALSSLVQSAPISISGWLGGKLADAHGYTFGFLITSCVYCVANLIYSPLLALVPRKALPNPPESNRASHEIANSRPRARRTPKISFEGGQGPESTVAGAAAEAAAMKIEQEESAAAAGEEAALAEHEALASAEEGHEKSTGG